MDAVISSSVEENKSFELDAKINTNGKIIASIKNIKLVKGEMVLIALVQKQASTKVKRGENAGKELMHVNVVKEFFVLTENKNFTLFNLPVKNPYAIFSGCIDTKH